MHSEVCVYANTGISMHVLILNIDIFSGFLFTDNVVDIHTHKDFLGLTYRQT